MQWQKEVTAPIIMYSVTQNGYDIEPATAAKLVKVDNIVGIRLSGNISQVAKIMNPDRR